MDPSTNKTSFDLANDVRSEWVLGVRGHVRMRGTKPDGTSLINPRIPTGEVEVIVLEAEILNKAKTPPFEINHQKKVGEEKRLEFRYLDLRRPIMQKNISIRSELNRVTRNYLYKQGFREIETPFLVKYTPGGARNFLVPSRLHPSSAYALAESPQLYKQLLMVGGYDKYFQIVRCFRDEDLRFDRQPEFTQIDIEMSFIDQYDVFRMIEKLIFHQWKEILNIDLYEDYPSGTFPHLDYEKSIQKYGSDKPDLRFGLEHIELTNIVQEHKGGNVPLLVDLVKKAENKHETNHIVKALVIPAKHKISRKEIDDLETFVKSMGSQGLARARVTENGSWTQSPFAKTISDDLRMNINKACHANNGDLIFFQFGHPTQVHTTLANLRLHLGKQIKLDGSLTLAFYMDRKSSFI